MTTSRSSNSRQKVTLVIFIIIIAIVGWQVYALFKSDTPAAPPPPKPAIKAAAPQGTPPQMSGNIPPPAQTPPALPPALPKPPVLSSKELELIRLQKQTEERYIAAVNQLQMLKIEREIAETNRSIATARLEAATSEKAMAGLTQSSGYSQNITGPSSQPMVSAETLPSITANNYVVISVSYLQGKWSAVLGSQGKLYQIYIGDVLPDTEIKVVDINKSGVTLKIGEEKRKISLVPII